MTNEELLEIIEKAAKDGVTELDLWGRGLTTLSPEIGRLTNLETLFLSYNQLQALPPEIVRRRLLKNQNICIAPKLFSTSDCFRLLVNIAPRNPSLIVVLPDFNNVQKEEKQAYAGT